MHVRYCRAILEMNNESVANGTGIDMVATYTCSPGYAFTGHQHFFLFVFISFDPSLYSYTIWRIEKYWFVTDFFADWFENRFFCLSTNAIHKKLRSFVDFFQKIDSFWKRLILLKRQIEPSLFTYSQYLLWVVLIVFFGSYLFSIAQSWHILICFPFEFGLCSLPMHPLSQFSV